MAPAVVEPRLRKAVTGPYMENFAGDGRFIAAGAVIQAQDRQELRQLCCVYEQSATALEYGDRARQLVEVKPARQIRRRAFVIALTFISTQTVL